MSPELEQLIQHLRRVLVVLDDQDEEPTPVPRCRAALGYGLISRLAERDPQGERRPAPRASAVRRDPAAVELGEPLRERQAQAEPSFGSREILVRLAERVEEPREELRLDAHAGIRDADHREPARVIELGANLHQTALVRESRGVVQEVADHLREPDRIPIDPQRTRGPGDDEAQPRGLQGRPVVLGGQTRDRGEVAGLPLERELPPGDARDVEEIIDQPSHVRDLAIDDVPRPIEPRLRLPEPPEDLHGAADRGQRIAELVGEDGDELVLAAIGLPQRLLRLALRGDVGVRAEPADDAPRIIAERESAREEPPIPASMAAQREGVLPGLAARDVPAELLGDARDVLGVVELLPAPTLHLLERRPGEFEPAPVVPEDVARLVGHPGELRDVVGEGPEQHLALAQRRLGPLPLRDVDRRGDEVGDASGLVMERRHLEVDRHSGVARHTHDHVVADDLSARRALARDAELLLDVLRVAPPGAVPELLPAHVVDGDPCRGERGLVRVQERAGRVEHADEGEQLVDDPQRDPFAPARDAIGFRSHARSSPHSQRDDKRARGPFRAADPSVTMSRAPPARLGAGG